MSEFWNLRVVNDGPFYYVGKWAREPISGNIAAMHQIAERMVIMANSIIRTLCREILRAFHSGKFTFSAFGKLFGIEHVSGMEYRIVTSENSDVGLRFMNERGKLRFFMA